MTLYTKRATGFTEIKESPFKLEKEIQKFFEANLLSIMSLLPVKSEFTIKNRRIDTLAFNPESKAFVIIEYKRDKNFSVIDQGFAYLGLMLDNQADFILEYNETLASKLERKDVDWSQSKVVFVSTGFTETQIEANNFRDLPIELWEVKQYENDSILVNPIKKSNAAPSIKPIAQQSAALNKVSKEIIVYSEQDHVKKASDSVAELFEKFKSAITNLSDGIDIVYLKYWLNFDKGKNTIASIEVQKNSLNVFINKKKGELNDAKGITRDISAIGHYGKGDYLIKVENDSNLEYIMSLIKQALSK